jgi:hypothetical protein
LKSGSIFYTYSTPQFRPATFKCSLATLGQWPPYWTTQIEESHCWRWSHNSLDLSLTFTTSGSQNGCQRTKYCINNKNKTMKSPPGNFFLKFSTYTYKLCSAVTLNQKRNWESGKLDFSDFHRVHKDGLRTEICSPTNQDYHRHLFKNKMKNICKTNKISRNSKNVLFFIICIYI